MSTGLEAFLMASEQDVQIFGCKDLELLEEVLQATQEMRVSFDEQFDVEETQQISHGQALSEIVEGKITRPDCGAIYGWAFRLYCGSMGEFLNNGPFMPCDWEWYEQVDSVLQTNEVPLRFSQLIGKCPIPIPDPDDWPMIGHWTHDQIVAGPQRMGACIAAATDPMIREALSVVDKDWLGLAMGQAGSVIVGFHG